MDPEDAHLAAESGADALVVSNHGGRQLDGAPSSIHTDIREVDDRILLPDALNFASGASVGRFVVAGGDVVQRCDGASQGATRFSGQL